MRGESTNELLPFEMRMLGLLVIFLVMTALRIWFDLAEADIVLNDQRGSAQIHLGGLTAHLPQPGPFAGSLCRHHDCSGDHTGRRCRAWMMFVAPERIWAAFVVGQVTLLLLLIPRFWQRGVAVSYWQQHMMVPVVAAIRSHRSGAGSSCTGTARSDVPSRHRRNAGN